METVTDLYDICIRLIHGAVIRYRSITGDNLKIWKRRQPLCNVPDLTRWEQINDPVCINIYHNGSIGTPLFKGKIVYTYLSNLFFHWEGYLFFKRLQMVLFPTSAIPLLKISAAFRELTFRETSTILSRSRLLFLAFGPIKEKVSILWKGRFCLGSRALVIIRRKL